MAKLEFEDIGFSEDTRLQDRIRAVFLRIFETYIDREHLERIGRFIIKDGSIEFPDLSEKEVQNKFLPLLDRAFKGLKSTLTGRRTVYVHRNSGIPLIGTLYFGIVDRGTNMVEVKPITGCNIDCPFCSVDEGRSSRKLVDFVVERHYIIQELDRLIDYKQKGKEAGKKSEKEAGKEMKIDVFVNTHGEPLLYADIVGLVKGFRGMKQINTVSIITNGTLLTKKLADELIGAGLNQMNLSLNAMDAEKAKELAGTQGYDLGNILEIARYLAKKLKLIIAPVWIKGVNDEEIPKIISFAKGIGAELGIQNYLVHRLGKKMAEQVSWEDFYKQLDEWEKQTGIKLRAEHTLYKTKPLEKPFRKGDVVQAEIMSPGRMKKEVLAAAQGRAISVVNCGKTRGNVKVSILRDKDNVFVGEEV